MTNAAAAGRDARDARFLVAIITPSLSHRPLNSGSLPAKRATIPPPHCGDQKIRNLRAGKILRYASEQSAIISLYPTPFRIESFAATPFDIYGRRRNV